MDKSDRICEAYDLARWLADEQFCGPEGMCKTQADLVHLDKMPQDYIEWQTRKAEEIAAKLNTLADELYHWPTSGHPDATPVCDWLMNWVPERYSGYGLYLMHLLDAPTEVFSRRFSVAWDCAHRSVINAAGTRSVLRAMFKRAAVPIPETLPETVTIWRGTTALPLNKAQKGYSWTTDRQVACWFAMRYLSKDATPLVLKAEVPRSKILYYSNDRNEAEVIVFDAGKDVVVDGSQDDWRQQFEDLCSRKNLT